MRGQSLPTSRPDHPLGGGRQHCGNRVKLNNVRIAVLVVPLLPLAGALLAEDVSFNRDVRPILSENCFKCHGPDSNARQAGLRLDRRDDALAAKAIVPGDLTASKLVQRIRATDARKMPPEWSNKKLSDEQRDLLATWIEQGGEFESHWSYIPPRRQSDETIDSLIGRKLAEQGLEPAAEADRRTLARRLSFDLTGLPPDPELVDEFVQSGARQAYADLLDKFLASPHFGERMAVHWLDLVRYADTVGYHNDLPVDIYPFRDYVIRAFNENKPFDEFTREQLAGDLLPASTVSQKVASGYNRLNRMTNEGGSQPKEYLAKYAADRVRNVSTVWLGSTLGCAECHDHKFDPFLAKDFYSMGAFFADIEEVGVYSGRKQFGPRIQVLSDDALREIATIDSKIAELKASGEGKNEASPANVAALGKHTRKAANSWRTLDPARVWLDCTDPDLKQEECERAGISEVGDGLVELSLTGKKKPTKAVERVEIELKGKPIRAVLFEAFVHEPFHKFSLTEFRVEMLGDGRPKRLEFSELLADFEGDNSLIRNTIDDSHKRFTAWSGDLCLEGERRAAFVLAEPIKPQAGQRLRITMKYDGPMVGRFRLSATDAAVPELPLSESVRKTLESDPSSEKALAEFERLTSSNSNWREIGRLERRKKQLVDWADWSITTQAIDQPREMRILGRGNWMDESGEIVEPQIPQFLGPIQTEGRLTRLDLANWLVDRKNPLTARVFVNRVWKVFFGTGLSKILDDIGSQGAPLAHQELLDWLAVEFMESGWDVKRLIRTMMMSQTYRRSSEPTQELLAADPYNRLHGRQQMQRLEAEFIRDNALAVSGLLNTKIGGRSSKPYQPEGYYKELNFPRRVYEADFNDRQHRRGLYTHWQRTFLHPSMMAFDAPAREECTAERSVSNTPLQSLALLNDPTYVEAAKAFAERILSEAPKSAEERIDFAFEEAFSRKASADEREILVELLDGQKERFSSERPRAEQLLATGLTAPDRRAKKAELAAWTSVARALMNKHEFVMRY